VPAGSPARSIRRGRLPYWLSGSARCCNKTVARP
jgi:hypothetical protein